MGRVEKEWALSLTRRAALRNVAAFFAGSPLMLAQQDPFRDHSRVPGMDELLTAFDFEPVAYAKLPREAYDYTAYGTESEFTLRRNRQAFDWVDLTPKIVVNVSQVNTATEVLGTKLAFPILVAPTAAHAALHPEGEAGTYRAATDASNTPMIISNNASMPVAKIAAAAKGNLWWQLYPRQDLDASKELLDTAQSSGAQAIVVTMDQGAAVWERALHYRNLGRAGVGGRGAAAAGRGGRGGAGGRGGGSNPYRISTNRLWYNWPYIDQIRPMVKVPMLAKGILTAEDAVLCVEHGLNGIVVSNHGGRAMDYSPATLEVLPEIVDAVRGRIPVLVDGGFRRGSDILKALALGAKAVCLGRVPRWGLGAYGAPGVQRILEILQTELALAMSHTGCPTLASIDRTLVRTHFS
jgi:4-hydroxymandelate oxidase